MQFLSALQAFLFMFAPIQDSDVELKETGFRIQIYPYGGYYYYGYRCPPGYYYGYRYGYPGCYYYGPGYRYYYGPRYYYRYPRHYGRKHHGRKHRRHRRR